MKSNIKTDIKTIWSEYEQGQQYKNSIGEKGIHDQARINERFFVGDQWHGVNAGNDKPLTRRNIIKRIGEYKMACIGNAPIAVNYTAEGVPNTYDLQNDNSMRSQMMGGNYMQGRVSDEEVTIVMSALTDYFKTTAERVKYDDKKDLMLKNAYISGTGILYTYWDSDIFTGLYADQEKTVPIKGDIDCEVLDIENVVFGDANNEDVQSQPYIIIAQRKDMAAVKRMAEKYGQPTDKIVPDNSYGSYKNSGDRGINEPNNSKRVTVITKLFKKYDEFGNATVWGKTVTENSIIRPEWNLMIHMYPIAKYVWERRKSCAYGDSEITYQIPNQIALNQAHSISVWAMQNTGMPKTIINGDLVPDGISNDPAEVIKIYGTAEDMMSAIRYVAPPNYGAAFINFTNAFAQNILSDSGATDMALGNFRPDNATAIVQAREAAMAPMQSYQNRFYSMNEDVARIWADFWITMYGRRLIKLNNGGTVEYMSFDAERYKGLVITARIDIGTSTLWSEAVSISNLGNLLQSQLITFEEYLERIPKGLIPNVGGLLSDRKKAEMQKQAMAAKAEQQAYAEQMQQQQLGTQSEPSESIGANELVEYIKQNRPELYEKLMSLSTEERARVIALMQSKMRNDGETA